MLADVIKTIERLQSLIVIAGLRYVLDYRGNRIGTWWVFLNPLTYVAFLGVIYSHLNNVEFVYYIKYLAVGIITWNLISSLFIDSARVFIRYRGFFVQGEMSASDVIALHIIQQVLTFLQQSPLAIAILLFDYSHLGWPVLTVIPAILLIIASGFCVTLILGVIGARFKDSIELTAALGRILFLVTPILWMATGVSGRSALLKAYVHGNPFFHMLELIRQPLVDGTIPYVSWAAVIVMTVVLAWIASKFYARYKEYVVLWL